MDTRSATSTQSFAYQQSPQHLARRKPAQATVTTHNDYARGSLTAGLSRDILGVVNASRIAALQGVTIVAPADRPPKVEQTAADAYRQSQEATHASAVGSPTSPAS